MRCAKVDAVGRMSPSPTTRAKGDNVTPIQQKTAVPAAGEKKDEEALPAASGDVVFF